MKAKKQLRSFRGAAELAEHAAKAISYLKDVCVACEAGDKAGAQRAMRQALNELETGRAGLRLGME